MPSLSAGACVVGQAHTISMTTTDPDSDPIRYLIDWDANGMVDQFMPASGYVPSGTAQTASRTYALVGSKTLQVHAEDDTGNLSGWKSLTFNCSNSATGGINEGGNGNGGGGGTESSLPALDLRVVPSLVRSGATTKVHWSATNVDSCSVSGQNGDAWNGIQSPLGGKTSRPITAETTYTLSCHTPDGATLTKSATVRIIPTFQEI